MASRVTLVAFVSAALVSTGARAAEPDAPWSGIELAEPTTNVEVPASASDSSWQTEDGTVAGTRELQPRIHDDWTTTVSRAPPDGSGLFALSIPVGLGALGGCSAGLVHIARYGVSTEVVSYAASDDAVAPDTILAGVGVGLACAALPFGLPLIASTVARRHDAWLRSHEVVGERQGGGLLVGGASTLALGLAAIPTGAVLVTDRHPRAGWALVGLGAAAVGASVPLLRVGAVRRAAYLDGGGFHRGPDTRDRPDFELAPQITPVQSPGDPWRATGLTAGVTGRF